MNARLQALLMRLYPAPWRARYGAELEGLIAAAQTDRHPGLRTTADLAVAGFRERLRAWGLSGDDPGERARAGLLLVLCSWALVVLGGAGVQRFSEHWQAATPRTSRGLATDAFHALVLAGSAGCVLIAAGILVALPSLVRLLRSGGWPGLRVPLAAALALTLASIAAGSLLVGWAHGLSSSQRNGADMLYVAGFLFWAGLLSATLLAWTGAAVACGRRISLSSHLLKVEAGLAVAVAIASFIVTAAACVWWGALAANAPWVLTGRAPGSGANALAVPMLLATALMALGTLIALIGACNGARALAPTHRS